MAYQYLVGGLIASLLVLVFLYNNIITQVKGFSKARTSSSMDFPNCRKKTGCKVAGSTTDIIIVGAGVAGSALAYALGKDGRRVQVIERDLSEPHRFVGEALIPGGYLKLMELGLQDCVDKIDAQPFFGYVLYKDGKATKLPYPLKDFSLDVCGRGFHNGRFVQQIRNKASSLPNVSLEQGTVTSLVEENRIIKGVRYKTKSGQELTAFAPLTVVCDGCFSNLRRSLCNPKVDVPSHFVAFILENCELPHPSYGHYIIANPSVVLFYRISSTEVRCMVDVPSQKLPSVCNGEMAHYLKTVVAPQIPQELYAAFISAIDKKNNIRTMPNRVMAAAPQPTSGALLMGDAFNMRHPLTGGGMTVALSDVVVLKDLLRPLHDLSDSSALCKYLEAFFTLRKPMASTINTVAAVMHRVVSNSSSDPAEVGMRLACFGYLSLGGSFSNGLVAIFSGLNPRPLSLLLHLIAVAIYGVGRLLLPFPSPKRIWTAARFIWIGLGVLFSLAKSEGVRPTFFPLTMPAYHRAPFVTNKNTGNFFLKNISAWKFRGWPSLQGGRKLLLINVSFFSFFFSFLFFSFLFFLLSSNK